MRLALMRQKILELLPLPDFSCPLFIDIETLVTPTVSLKKMPFRLYLQQTRITGLSFALGWEADPVYVEEADLAKVVPFLAECCTSLPVFAHNNSFDFRVLTSKLGLPYPEHPFCTMELAQAAWPNHPGGYSLSNLSVSLSDMPPKLTIDLRDGKHTVEEMRAYCNRDVQVCRAIARQALQIVPDIELLLARLTGCSRKIQFNIDAQRLQDAFETFDTQASEAAEELIHLFEGWDADASEVFGWDDGKGVRSVKPHVLKDLLLDCWGFVTPTISQKKINAEELRRNPEARTAIQHAGAANKSLSYRRRINALSGVDVADLNLCYAAAHTFRWSGKGTGRGVNIHNMPKHNKKVAKPFRSMLRLPPEYCWVRVDAANLEYRIECMLSGCEHGVRLFEQDVFADPYSEFGFAAIGKRCSKKDPIRQLWKMTVLGLGFLMGLYTHAKNLTNMLSEPEIYKITLDDLKAICDENRWRMPNIPYAKSVVTKLRVPEEIVAAAYHTKKLFHEVHPEFERLARWVTQVLEGVCRVSDPQTHIDRMYQMRSAPDRSMLNIQYDPSFEGKSVRIGCGPWPPTLVWRDIGVRRDRFGDVCMCSMKAGNKGYEKLSPNIILENITQAAGRNGIAQGMLYLAALGYHEQASIHDEELLRVPRTCEAVWGARESLIRVYGPGGLVPATWGWSTVGFADEITVTSSFWEEDMPADFWDRVKAGDESALDELA